MKIINGLKSENRLVITLLLIAFVSLLAASPAPAAELKKARDGSSPCGTSSPCGSAGPCGRSSPCGNSGPCATCGPCGGAGGAVTPYGDTGCGPRYCGAKHDEPSTPDPCDSCNRWRGCNGAYERPDMLAPWQLPPGRGFQTAADVGYAGNGGGGPCLECRSPIYRLW